MNESLTAAISYASQGFPIIILHSVVEKSGRLVCTCGNASCPSPGKHPRTEHGYKDATTDQRLIRDWLNSWPGSNIGIAMTGKPSILVIDVDPRNGGEHSEEQLLEQFPELKDTLIILTGGGGKHYYLRVLGKPSFSLQSTPFSGIDIKYLTGYVVVPPSKHISGKRYEVEMSCEFVFTDMLEASDALLKALSKQSYLKAETKVQNPGKTFVYEGSRNNFLTSEAGKLKNLGYDRELIDSMIQSINQSVCKPALPAFEVSKIAASISKYPNSNNKVTKSMTISVPTIGKPTCTLDDDMFYGLPGEIVRTLSPETESHPVALLVYLLAVFGNMVAWQRFFIADGVRHYPVLFACLVGPSSTGRKGTAWQQIQRFIKLEFPDWYENHVVSGLSSGEGLINFLSSDEMHNEIKQAFVNEPEFASVLKNTFRQGNNLSPVIRNSWDSSGLKVLTRSNPLSADNFHLSLMGHITPNELNKLLNDTEQKNGFGNRLLWPYVERQQALPFGGSSSTVFLEPLAVKFLACVERLEQIVKVNMSEGSMELWVQEYERLTSYPDTIEGSLLQRGAPYVRRIAMIYALMDNSDVIELPHLKAALSLWKYNEDSVRYIFGNNEIDTVLQKLLEVISNAGKQGATRTQITNAFNNHLDANTLTEKLNQLLSTNKIIENKLANGNGRNATVYQLNNIEN